MIKEILEQLAPLDAQIAALKGNGNDMEAITAHASELAELAVEEDEILRSCGPLTAEDRVFLARHPERPHIDETVSALFTDFFEQRGDRQCKEDSAILGGRGPVPWAAGDRHRPPQGFHAGRESGLQLRDARPGRVPQGSASDEAG